MWHICWGHRLNTLTHRTHLKQNNDRIYRKKKKNQKQQTPFRALKIPYPISAEKYTQGVKCWDYSVLYCQLQCIFHHHVLWASLKQGDNITDDKSTEVCGPLDHMRSSLHSQSRCKQMCTLLQSSFLFHIQGLLTALRSSWYSLILSLRMNLCKKYKEIAFPKPPPPPFFPLNFLFLNENDDQM